MPLFRRSAPAAVQEPRKPKTVLAAAVNISDAPSAWKARSGEDAWQKDAWYYYDAVGELRFVTKWLANAISRAQMYVAEIDPATGLETGPTDNAKAQQILSTIFGGAARRSQAQSTMALNYAVAGEFFILIRPRPGEPDEWLTLSSREITERGGSFKYTDPNTGLIVTMNSATDLLIRVWEPHPASQINADSSVRAALPILREIERTSMNIASRLDSRLSGAGVWLIPKEIDFPMGDTDASSAEGVMEELLNSAKASLANPGEASAQVPIVFEVPGEHVANFQYQTFATELTAEVLELRPAAIRRLATTVDMPTEIIEGLANSNHWSAWQIEEAGYKIHVQPVLDRIADAITTQYLHPALEASGVSDFETYSISFDVTDVVSRPNRQAEMLELFDRELISEEAVRSEAGVPDDDIPSDEELEKRFYRKLVLQDTSLLQDPGVRQILGLPEIVTQSSVPQIEATTPNRETNTDRALPERDTDNDGETDPGLVAAAELMVFDALSRSGGRLLTRQYRHTMDDVPKHELHTKISGSPGVLLEGSFQFADAVAPAFNRDPNKLTSQLRQYCTVLIAEQRIHNREEMASWLSR